MSSNRPSDDARLRNFFGFKRHPFAKNLDSDEAFLYPPFEDALQRLDYLASRKGIGLLVGPPGLGKSTLLRRFLAGLSPNAHHAAYLRFANCSPGDLFRQIARLFGLTPGHRKTDVMAQISERIVKLGRDQRLRPVLVIDDAQQLSAATLDELRLLTNFDVDGCDELVLILAGQTQLDAYLRLAVNEPLAQRIIIRAHLKELDRQEIEAYLLFRLKAAGRPDRLFQPDAVEALATASRGLPRRIDRIAEHALLIAMKNKAKAIDAEMVTLAIKETAP